MDQENGALFCKFSSFFVFHLMSKTMKTSEHPSRLLLMCVGHEFESFPNQTC